MGKRILVMDDDELMQELFADMLEDLGYECSFAVEGGRAIELYREAMEGGTPFDLVIMDLTVPAGMGGKETIGGLLRLDPEVRAVVTSGRTSDRAVANHESFGFVGALGKPFTLDEIEELLARIMGA